MNKSAEAVQRKAERSPYLYKIIGNRSTALSISGEHPSAALHSSMLRKGSRESITWTKIAPSPSWTIILWCFRAPHGFVFSAFSACFGYFFRFNFSSVVWCLQTLALQPHKKKEVYFSMQIKLRIVACFDTL